MDMKQYFTRNLKKVISKFGNVALLDEISKNNLDRALQEEIDAKAVNADLTDVTSKVTILVGNVAGDDTKSARTMASEEVAKIVADAPASFDTLKEIADWISNHPEDTTAMNSAIVALKAKTVLGTYIPEGETDPTEYLTVKDYVEAYVKDQMQVNPTLASLSIAAATGTGNVITNMTYDYKTGVFTPTKGITAAQLNDLSIGNATGNGNVVTGLIYDSNTGEFNVVKGSVAVLESDLVELTDEEVDALFV